MKLKIKNFISFLVLTFSFCFIIGAGYTVARYAGVFDGGSFNLTIESGMEPLYTIVYHTFSGSTDVVLSRVDYYEEGELSMRGAPGTVSGDAYNYTSLSFFGWSPQGVWTPDEESYFTTDTSNVENYVPDTRILYKTGDTVALSTLAEFSGNEIHLYDIYKNYYVKVYDRPLASVVYAASISIIIRDTNGKDLYNRYYTSDEFVGYRYTAPGVKTSIRCNAYALQRNSYGVDSEGNAVDKENWYHYVHPGLTVYAFNNMTVDTGTLLGKYDTLISQSTTADGSKELSFVMPNSSTILATKVKKVGDSDVETCFTAGTLITMADGSKLPIEAVKQGDMVRVYDHENGCYTTKPVLFVEYDGDAEWNVINLEFSDGTTQKFIYEHGLFDLTLNKYVYITEENYQDFIGHQFAKEEAEGYSAITLVDSYMQREFTGCYSMTTEYHMNHMANGMLSMPGGITGLFNFFEYDENLAYDKALMAQDIEEYGLFTYEDFAAYMSEETFNTIFPIKYLKVSLGKGLATFEDLEYIIERYIYRHGLDG